MNAGNSNRHTGFARQIRQIALRGFTLIELMAVMAIMAILLSISLAAFRSMGSGSGIRASGINFKGAVSQARQYAITKRKRTTLHYDNFQGLTPRGYYVISNTVDGIMGTTNWLSEGIVFVDDGDTIPDADDQDRYAHIGPLEFNYDGSANISGAGNMTPVWIGIRESTPGSLTNVQHVVMRFAPLTGRLIFERR